MENFDTREFIKSLIVPVIVLLLITTTIFVYVNYIRKPYSDEEIFKYGNVTKVEENKFYLGSGELFEIDSETTYTNSRDDIELTEDILEDNYVEFKYITNGETNLVTDITLNINPVFVGTIIEVTNLKAVVEPNEDETYIRSSADKVYVSLPDNSNYSVGDVITVRYDGRLMESYPLQIITKSVDGVVVS